MMTFDQFRLGDYVVFDRTFSHADFEVFSKLSGDANPLHHDQLYATQHAPDGALIVPLHLTLAPLSLVAGMIFPGEPSLYLGHDVRAIKTVRYDEPLRYSARIASINRSHRILTLRVLALRESEVVLDATLRVQARSNCWASGPSDLIHHREKGNVLITGSNGEIGTAIALAFAKNGWRLVLQDRGSDARRKNLMEALEHIGAEVRFVACDLRKTENLDPILATLAEVDSLEIVVHAASPAITASTDELVTVNFSALKQISDVAIPKMLAHQHGSIVLLGTSAVRAPLPGWEAYCGAKSMAMNLIDAIERRFASYGIRGYTLAPGYVATRFSMPYRSKSDAALLPAEVAETLIALATSDEQSGNTIFMEPGSVTRGQYTLQFSQELSKEVATTTPPLPTPATQTPLRPDDRIAPVVRPALRLPANYDMRGGGLGLTPGWDSLKHIEIILAIESQLGLHFKSSEIETTHRYDDLVALCIQKMEANTRAS